MDLTLHDESQQATLPRFNRTPCTRLLADTSQAPPALAQLMAPDLLLSQNSQEHLENLAKEPLGAYDTWPRGIVPRAALAVLWLATHRHDVELMVA